MAQNKSSDVFGLSSDGMHGYHTTIRNIFFKIYIYLNALKIIDKNKLKKNVLEHVLGYFIMTLSFYFIKLMINDYIYGKYIYLLI